MPLTHQEPSFRSSLPMVVERSAAAVRAFRQIISELRRSDKSFSSESEQLAFMKKEFAKHETTQRVWSKANNETEHIAGVYAHYLSSTRKLLGLQREYKGGERSIEDSASLVGLKLPQRK